MGSETTEDRAYLAIRWVVLFTGFTAAEDYRPTASQGESAAIIAEVTNLCVAFHPISQIHRMPRETPVFLFWRIQSTGDWVITRVSIAPNPDGLRTALEYCSLLFTDDAFRALRCNPFRTRSLNLHDRVRRHFLAKKTDALQYALGKSIAPQVAPVNSPPALAEARSLAVVVGETFPALSKERDATEENVAALQEYCSRWSENPVPPPTFATWWPSRGALPAGYFEIVLRAPEPKALTLQEARTAVSQLAADLKASLPRPDVSDLAAVDLVHSLLAEASDAEDEVSQAVAYVQTESPDALRTHLTKTSLKISRLRADLGALLVRLERDLPSDDMLRLQSIVSRSEEIENAMQAIRHPNPFQKFGGAPHTSVAQTTSSAKVEGSQGFVTPMSAPPSRATSPVTKNRSDAKRRGLAVATAIALVVGVLLYWLLTRSRS